MILVDGMLLMHRCYHKMDFLQNSSGVKTGMEFGFLKSLESIQKKLNTDKTNHKIVVFWEHGNTFRYNIYPEYKANRRAEHETPEHEFFIKRVNQFKDIVNILYDNVYAYGSEADEAIASFAHDNIHLSDMFIYSNDKDLLQLIQEDIVVVKSHRSNLYIWDKYKFGEEYGFAPVGMVWWLALTGDSVDNIPGVPRIRKDDVRMAIREALEDAEDKDDNDVISGFYEFPWTGATKMAVQIFINEGYLQRNKQLVTLRNVRYVHNKPSETKRKVIEDWCRTMEITSLKFCKEFGVYADDEF